jgi:endonuclease-3 related protein
MRPSRGVLAALFAELLAAYGPQGWWPLPSRAGQRGFDTHGYHPGRLDHPRSRADRFEIALGAVLTQNTAWSNAERALGALAAAGLHSGARATPHRPVVPLPEDILACGTRTLARLVRASGSYNAKARKLRTLASFFVEHGLAHAPDRHSLLEVWGVGPETADSILLYAFGEPVFVIDAYTRRLLARRGVIEGTEPYAHVQELFHRALEPDAGTCSEYHALVVRHAKEHCRARPRCPGCPVRGCPSRDEQWAGPATRLVSSPRSRHDRRR